MSSTAKFLTARQVRDRFGGISEMTLWRWLNGETAFPKPLTINRRRFWKITDVEAFEDRTEAGKAAA